MNRKQVIILTAGIALLTFSELFLPWRYTDNLTSAERSAGYHFITAKPPQKNADELRALFAYPEGHVGDPENARLSVNSGRLILQRLVIALFTFALIILCKTNSSKGWRIFGVLTLLLVLPPLALWFLEVNAKGL
jgi:hypothetical protein